MFQNVPLGRNRHHEQSARPAPQLRRQCRDRGRRDPPRGCPGGRAARERTRSARPQDGQRRYRGRSPGAQVRPDHRLRLEADPAGAMGARAQLRDAGLRARLSLQRGRAAGRVPAGSGAGDVPGLSARQRQDRHAQLSRHSDLGELLGDGRAPDRARGRAVGNAGGLSQRRRHHSARARHGLRHGGEGRGLRDAQAHAMGLCRQSQHGRRHHGRAGLRGFPDRPHEGGIRRRRKRSVPEHDDPGDRRHAQDRRGRARARRRRCCRSSTRRNARRRRRAN